MTRITTGLTAVLLAALIGASLVTATVGQSPSVDPAMTALTSTEDTTLGRRFLMLSIGSNNDMLHEMFDEVLPMDELEMRGRLDSISAMLYAFPSLYRAQPNPYTEEGNKADAARVSLALPSVWESFDMFRQLSLEAAQKAKDAAEGHFDTMLAQVEELEEMCESCHETYRQPFVFLDYDDIEAMR